MIRQDAFVQRRHALVDGQSALKQKPHAMCSSRFDHVSSFDLFILLNLYK